jgi:hypothetical protein
LTTTYVGATQLTAAVPFNLITSAGTAAITVSSRGVISNSLPFAIPNGSGIGISPATLSNGFVGLVYPTTALTAQGGLAPYSWAAVGLPPGLTLTSAGVLSGKPNTL